MQSRIVFVAAAIGAAFIAFMLLDPFWRAATGPEDNATFTGSTAWKTQLHPYFAHISIPENPAGASHIRLDNIGITHAPEAAERWPEILVRPIKRLDSDILICFFGGSVAAATAYWAEKHRDWFSDLIAPAFPGKNVKAINCAIVGHKQPSHLNILSHLLALGETFDLVINLDGFNDAIIATSNADVGMHYSWPSRQWKRAVDALSEKSAVVIAPPVERAGGGA